MLLGFQCTMIRSLTFAHQMPQLPAIVNLWDRKPFPFSTIKLLLLVAQYTGSTCTTPGEPRELTCSNASHLPRSTAPHRFILFALPGKSQ